MLTSDTRALWNKCFNIFLQAVIVAATFMALTVVGLLFNYGLQIALKSVNAGEFTLRAATYLSIGYFVIIGLAMMVTSVHDAWRVVRATFFSTDTDEKANRDDTR